MSAVNASSLILNGAVLALALCFLLIILWHDARKEMHLAFAALLVMVMFWYLGASVAQTAVLVDRDSPVLNPALSLLEFGFTGSTIAAYVVTSTLVKVQTRRVRALAFVTLLVVITYRIVLLLGNAPSTIIPLEGGAFTLRAQTLAVVIFIIFGGGTLLLLARHYRRAQSPALVVGLVVFVIGQGIGLLNPELQTFALATSVNALATLLIAVAILWIEVIRPLTQRTSQVGALRELSVSIVNLTTVDDLLRQIADQAARLMDADAAAVFLLEGDDLRLAAAHNLPDGYIGMRKPNGAGIAGAVVQSKRVMQIDNYLTDWHGEDDMPLARETFGAVLCAPLTVVGDVIGALMVIASRQNRLFDREDAFFLQMLAAQASVAIAHSHLFSEQRDLTQAVESARAQLETVLTATESPVVAINRDFRVIFANPAARALFSPPVDPIGRLIFEVAPVYPLPADLRKSLRMLRQAGGLTYELEIENRTYLCHLAAFGRPRAAGWVAVLNDVSQLKELDRIKSEMVRMTSHDLKNPLQAAMANLELLRDDVYASGTDDVRQSIAAIERQLQRMSRIIRGILDLERVRSGRLTFELCSPLEITERAVDEVKQFAAEQRINLSVGVPGMLPQFYCDKDQFQRALVNLIENAIKFTSAGGSVEITAALRDDSLVFCVADTGVGISEELQSKIFERFFRGKQQGMEHVTGSGLGLSLVKTIAENHRGKVWVVSKEGQGSKFYLMIPLRAV